MTRTLTATLPNGTTITRTTAKAYTHAVVIEFRYTNGNVQFGKANWASRLDLATKQADKERKACTHLAGTQCRGWRVDENGKGEWFDRDYGYDDVIVHIIPVNA